MGWRSERPLRRSLIKLFTTAFFGKAKAHAHNWLPGLSLIQPAGPNDTGEVRYRGERVAGLIHPAALKAAAGSEIFIVGSGPSVKENDLSATGEGSAILLNGAISLVGEEVKHPLAVAIEDERFVWRHFALMRQKIAAGTICLFSVGVIRAICEIDRRWLADKRIILIDDIRKPYKAPRRDNAAMAGFGFVRFDQDGVAGFSGEPSKGVFQGGSVAISALQFAIYCEPQRIGLFGIDISNANDPRFYEKAGNVAQSGIAGAQARILAHIAIAKQVAEERGMELLNFSRVSALRDCGLVYDARYARA